MIPAQLYTSQTTPGTTSQTTFSRVVRTVVLVSFILAGLIYTIINLQHHPHHPNKQVHNIDKSLFDPQTGIPLTNPLPTSLQPAPPSSSSSSDTISIVSTFNGAFSPSFASWLIYYQHIGVSHFYLFCEHASQTDFQEFERSVGDFLATPKAHLLTVKLVWKGGKISSIGRITKKSARLYCENPEICERVVKEGWLTGWFDLRCNGELFVRQSLNMEEAIVMALEDNVQWLAHIDGDELIYPGFVEGEETLDFRKALGKIDESVDSLLLVNWEGVPETPGGAESNIFEEITLFKKHHTDTKSARPFLTYANGKSVARVAPGLRSNGAHRFTTRGVWGKKKKTFVQEDFAGARILHYTYCKVSTARGRGLAGEKCGCEPTQEDAEACFILRFDQEVFLKSMELKEEEEFEKWYDEMIVWGKEREAEKEDMLSYGVMARVVLPKMIVL